MVEEIWKDIIGFEGLYQASNIGNIKNIKNNKNRILKKLISKHGYYIINLSKGKSRPFKVHRLVAQTFILNLENKKEVNHINGIKTDNRIENLEWVTHKENTYHSIYLLKNNNIFLNKIKNVNQYDLEGNFIKTWDGMNNIQKSLGIKQCNISKCCNGKIKTAYGFIWKFN